MSARRGIADDRAVAERPRPPFHAPLKPADDLAIGDRRRRSPAKLRLVRNVLDRAAGLVESRLCARRAASAMSSESELRPPIGVVHHERPLAAELVPDREGRADRAARIARGRLHIDALERGHSPHLAVGDRVHGAAARKREIGQSRIACAAPNQMKERLLIHRLHRARDVAMPILKRIVGLAARAQKLLERRREQIAEFGRAVRPLIRHLAPVMAEIVEVELEASRRASGERSCAWHPCRPACHKARGP